MANYLILNQNQVFNGLGTLTYNVTSTEAYNVAVQVTMPSAPPINPNIKDNSAGIGGGVPQGQRYLGAGSGAGIGAGTGGGAQGFVLGDRGLGFGGVGQGFGTGNNYQQPPAAGSNVTANAAQTSGLSVIVQKNAVTIYTAPVPAVAQGSLQFRFPFLANSGDAITVVLSSAVSSDNQLDGVTSNVSISQGLQS